MKRTLAVKKGERQLTVELDRLDAKYRKVKDLLAEALSHRYRFERAVKAVGHHGGTCWCAARITTGKLYHTAACDRLFFFAYAVERSE